MQSSITSLNRGSSAMPNMVLGKEDHVILNLSLTINDLAREIEDRGQTDLILLDFAKAFDKVSHRLFLHKMQHYGVTGCTLQWVDDFLKDRTQQVLVEGKASKEAHVVSGALCKWLRTVQEYSISSWCQASPRRSRCTAAGLGTHMAHAVLSIKVPSAALRSLRNPSPLPPPTTFTVPS